MPPLLPKTVYQQMDERNHSLIKNISNLKIPAHLVGYHPLSLYSKVSWSPPQNITGYYHCSGCPLAFDDMILLLKTPYTLVSSYGGIKLVLTKRFPCRFLSECGRCYVDCWREESHQQSDPAVNTVNQKNDLLRQDIPMTSIMA